MIKKIFTITILVSGFFLFPQKCPAQERSSTFTITPPLVKTNMSPGEEFASNIRVINNNSRKIRVYAKTANFKSKGDGKVDFLDEGEEGASGYTLKEWIILPQKKFTIGAFETKEIPYLIEVPKDASPGGHYAGILIGTLPPEAKAEERGASIAVSQVVSSLLLVNIEGDIVEKGYIREFVPNRTFIKGDKVDLNVTFENLGNVHLKPVGEIRIYNIFGKKKATIPINHKTGFAGNVLPEGRRSWKLTWSAEDEFVVANRYKAALTLGFGDEGKQADHRETFFWLIDIKTLVIIVGSITGFLALLFLSIKIYVRQSIRSMQKQVEAQKADKNNKKPPIKLKKDKGPEERVVDLRNKK